MILIIIVIVEQESLSETVNLNGLSIFHPKKTHQLPWNVVNMMRKMKNYLHHDDNHVIIKNPLII